MIKTILLFCLTIVFTSCLERQTNSENNNKLDSDIAINKQDDSLLKFSFSKTGYTNDLVDKFHHIQIIANSEINKINLSIIKAEILKTEESKLIIDSLEKEIMKLAMQDSISIGFIDNHTNQCQVHGGDCIFRYYRFEQNVNGEKHRFNSVKKNKVFVNGLPLTNYHIDSLLNKFGKPDSILHRERFGIGEGMHQSYYYGNSFFSVDEGDSLYYLESIDFKEQNFEIEIDGHSINSHSTLQDFRHAFPLSYLNIEYDTYKTGEYESRVRILNKSNGQIEDTSLLIEFIEGEISRFIYFIEWV